MCQERQIGLNHYSQRKTVLGDHPKLLIYRVLQIGSVELKGTLWILLTKIQGAIKRGNKIYRSILFRADIKIHFLSISPIISTQTLTRRPTQS